MLDVDFAGLLAREGSDKGEVVAELLFVVLDSQYVSGVASMGKIRGGWNEG